MAYNFGLGALLSSQSKHQSFTRAYDAFIKNNPGLVARVKDQLSKKMDASYNFESMPTEYNAWLVFRGIVDLILLSDFASFFMIFIAFGNWTLPVTSAGWATFIGCQILGAGLVVANWFIKVDALRVIKDFAWSPSQEAE
ncbi:hypothetical protein H696_04788 [Fonticula alba]|uniref:Uncharacterized protein n=1 Tax=Fonticula alba TaxID=691883 RepID=A0A058Z4T4_FONAL|nr:hypothetical protein H696_04788 [Fonticula alba]KCV68497.1 hypothetical protein H696_04788 [Fonticula alba]|eukprot:XP_009496929.1 hypothetical protein H696_04788 [Fonticula alba]